MATHDLPESELIRQLEEKAGSRRHDVAFDFLGRLSDFRRRVSDEVRHINVLFPEYTPHDEQYHLKRLFQVADKVLGAERLQGFNASELFVLAAALYGHDWGMAVSEPEKEYILTGNVPEGFREDELWILPNERQRLKRFAKEQRLSLDEKGCTAEMPIELWREYVRQTHAFRSGERVRRYFQPFDGGVANAVARAAEGHGLDFEQLQNYQSYPTDLAVLGEAINLRALAVYVRLIDLLDLAEDRTPYVIWKFVAPRNSTSRMEWKKHLAIHSVALSEYQEGRILVVDGSTDDYEVYAALQDLKRWVDDQFRGCNDLLARMKDPRHQLDLYGIEWRLSARGFKPISIQFEFDRSRMFEILSEEIYQGDPYVFLRELLQNSIDAIRMRREILGREGVAMAEPSIIRVDVKHGEDGNAEITWRDDGIGMDEYIVQNYLAVAGKSYYRSDDFEREHLQMDPIARFGVGILSCFMVADRINIETRREPYMPPQAKPLRITIPRVDKQFRVEVLGDEEMKPGTTINVYVEGRKLPLDEKTGKPATLKVAEYLCAVAGFVTFPILVTERGKRTLILHPYQAPSSLSFLGEDVHVHQLDLGYPWGDGFHPKDLSTAQHCMKEHRWDLKDLGRGRYEGILSYAVPISARFEFVYGHDAYVGIAISEGEERRIARMISVRGEFWGERTGLTQSSTRATHLGFYKDGILVSTISDLSGFSRGSYITRPFLMINVLGSVSRLDLARQHVVGENLELSRTLRESLLADLFEEHISASDKLSPMEKLERISWLALSFGLTAEEIVVRVPKELIPLPTVGRGGEVAFSFPDGQELLGFPWGLKFCYANDLNDVRSLFKEWVGPSFLIESTPRMGFAQPLSHAISIANFFWLKSCAPSRVQFLTSPGKGVPLALCVWSPVTVQVEREKVLLDRVVKDGYGSLDHAEKAVVSESLGLPDAYDFEAPMQEAMSYGAQLLNARHPIVGLLVRLAAFSALLGYQDKPDRELSLYVKDALTAVQSIFNRLDKPLQLALERARVLGLDVESRISVNQKEIIDPPEVKPFGGGPFGLPYEKTGPEQVAPGRRKKTTRRS